MKAHLFVDESRRGKSYFLAAAVIPVNKLSQARAEIRNLLESGRRKIHFSSEKEKVKLAALDCYSEFASVNIYVSEHKNDVTARYRCMLGLLADVEVLNTQRLVLESRASQDKRDTKWIISQRQRSDTWSFDHLAFHAEPLLWVADGVAWSYGRGGKWLKKVQDLDLVGSVKNCDHKSAKPT